MKTLVAGWFSFELMGATAGDLMTRDLACEWLTRAGRPYDIAVAPPFTGGVDWREVDPAGYSDVVFVCGPLGNGPPVDAFLADARPTLSRPDLPRSAGSTQGARVRAGGLFLHDRFSEAGDLWIGVADAPGRRLHPG